MKTRSPFVRRWLSLPALLALSSCGTVPIVQEHEKWQEENEELVVNEQGITAAPSAGP